MKEPIKVCLCDLDNEYAECGGRDYSHLLDVGVCSNGDDCLCNHRKKATITITEDTEQ